LNKGLLPKANYEPEQIEENGKESMYSEKIPVEKIGSKISVD
jgi:hypothetical protein|tara:strand:+ start:448 stop:573 length:126 start_codon:yes stop_codon:yes gene_type:complete